jgi:hypothetical protein
VRTALRTASAFLLLAVSACDTTDPGVDDDPLPDIDEVPTGDARAYHPVVLSEADGAPGLDPLLGTPVEDVVAFAYDASAGAFVQIPVQVDERYVYDVARVYEGITDCYNTWCEDLPGHVVTLGYADARAAAGPDPTAAFDADDEVALLLADFGDPAQGHPAGVETATAVEVQVTLDGADHYAYLYRRRDPTLQPDAGKNYVAYRFDLVRPVYDVAGVGPAEFTGRLTPTDHGVSNPEQSWVETGLYRMQFADRWVMDYLAVGPRSSRSPDLLTLDIFRGTDDPTDADYDGCARWPFTGSASEGGFLVSRDGPVRAIRRFVGFNSGPLTETTWTFYPLTVETVTTPRVHRLAHGLALFLHLSEAAEGYTYAYGTGSSGAAATDEVDGAPPTFGSADYPAWQTVRAPGGGVGWAATYEVATTIPFRLPDEQPRLFYADDDALVENCDIDDVTGTTYRTALTSYRGAHGLEVPFQTSWGPGSQLPEGGLPNTDPRHVDGDTDLYALSVRRRLAFSPNPGAALAAIELTPVVTVRAYAP